MVESNSLDNKVERPAKYKALAEKLGKRAAGIALVMAGTAAGAGLGVHNYGYETEVGGISADINMTVSFMNPGLELGAVVDSGPESNIKSDLGSIKFDDIDGLPLKADVTVYPDNQNIQSVILDRYDYVKIVKHDAELEAKRAVTTYIERAVAGGAVGGVMVGGGLGYMSYLRRRSDGLTHKDLYKQTLKSGVAGLGGAALALGGLSIYGKQSFNPDSSYVGSGMIGVALKASPEADFLGDSLKDPALAAIFKDFQAQNACPSATKPENTPPGSLTFTTYNIQRGSAGYEEVSQQIEMTESDVIGLQEVTPEALDYISSHTDMTAIYDWTIDTDNFKFGNAILTRLPIINLQTYQLPSENVEQRGLMVAELQKPDGQTFYMANTHLTNSNLGAIGDANHDLRKQQVDTVNQVIDDITEQTGKTVILVGDMNASSSTPEYKNLISQSMSDTIDISDDVNSTVPATGKDYDHILWTGDEDSVVENGDMRGGDGASDHCSLTTVLKVGIDLDGGWLADEHADELDDSLAPRD